MFQTAPASRQFARLTGLAYLLIAICGGFAFFVVSEQLFNADDAAQTLSNITDNMGLFRLGMAAYLVITVLDVLVAWMLFRLFAASTPGLALLASWMRIAYACVHGAAILHLLSIPPLLGGDDAAFSQNMIQHHMRAHLDGFLVSLAVFGVHLWVVGAMIIRTRLVPRLIGALVIAAGLAYVIDAFAFLLLDDYKSFYAATQVVIAVVATIGELSLLLWLLIRGVNAPDHSGDDMFERVPETD